MILTSLINISRFCVAQSRFLSDAHFKDIFYARSDVLTAMTMKIVISWDVMQCPLMKFARVP